MKVNTLKLSDPSYPSVLKDIAGPPKQLFFSGAQPQEWLDLPRVAIVGSRKISPYGKHVTRKFARELANSGVVVVSGLAFGVDAEAHWAALEANGLCVAVLPTPLDRISPVSNQQLASKIIGCDGTLVTEYSNGADVHVSNFIARNRIVSGLADVILITEAAVNSGSLHTARFALEQGKTVMAVPGNINSPTSEGCNNLIKSGAVPVTEFNDILFALKLNPAQQKQGRAFNGTKEETEVLKLISEGICIQEDLALATGLDGAAMGSILTMLEIHGRIRALGAGNWTIS
jgi:DNA processing protein